MMERLQYQTLPTISSDEIAAPFMIFQAAREKRRKQDLEEAKLAEQQRHQMAMEQAQSKRLDEQTRHQVDMEKSQNKRLDEQQRQANVKFYDEQGGILEKKRQAARAFIGQGDIGGAKSAVADVPYLDQAGKQQFGLPFRQLPEPEPVQVPSLTNLPPDLSHTLQKGASLQLMDEAMGVPNGSPEQSSRPPTPEEFQQYAGRPDSPLTHPPAYGERGEPSPPTSFPLDASDIASMRSDPELMAQGQARQAFQNAEYISSANDYLGKRKEALAAKEKRDAEIADARANPRYEIGGGPSGTPLIVSQNEERQRAGQQRHLDAVEFANAVSGERDPNAQKYAGLMTEMIEGGGMKRADAMASLMKFRAMDAKAQEDQFKRDQALTFEQRKELAHIGADPRWAGVQLGRDKFNSDEPRKDQAQVLKIATNIMNQRGFKGDYSTYVDLKNTSDNLLLHNSALDVTAGAQFAKKAQGAGVLTDKDYDRFWGAIGDGGDRPEDFFSMVINGRMGDGKRRIVLTAIAQKVKQEEGKLKGLANDIDNTMKAAGYYDAWVPLRYGMFGGVESGPPVQVQTSQQPAHPKGKAARGKKLHDILENGP